MQSNRMSILMRARARAKAREHAEMREARERSEARGRVEARERGGCFEVTSSDEPIGAN
jgi:hypothetical protein